MQRSSTGQLNPEIPPVTKDNNGVIRLLSFLSSGVPPVVSIFCIGLVSGAAGGLVLGATAVILLQSLELLADNRTLTNELEKFIKDSSHFNESNVQVRGIPISICSVSHGVFSSILSVAVGLAIGYSTYSLSEREQTERKGAAASGKALAVAGPVCLMVVTATGCLLGFTLESFLSITLNGATWLAIISTAVLLMFVVMNKFLSNYVIAFIVLMLGTQFAAFYQLIGCSLLRVRLSLALTFVPVTAAVILFQKSHPLKLHTIIVQSMLIISDVYSTTGRQIVALQSPTSTTTSSVVVEAIFVGVLASLMWTVSVGMSLFVALQKGGAGKICATAAATGTAVLGAIKLALPVMGPGPTIGALIGVAGAAGVSLAAAGAVTDRYQQVVHPCGWFGRLGVTVGAAVGAFFMSCSHSGLSVMFMALCAATVPAVPSLLHFLLSMFVQNTSLGLKECLYLHLVPEAVIFFNHISAFYLLLSNFHGGLFVLWIHHFFLLVLVFLVFWSYE